MGIQTKQKSKCEMYLLLLVYPPASSAAAAPKTCDTATAPRAQPAAGSARSGRKVQGRSRRNPCRTAILRSRGGQGQGQGQGQRKDGRELDAVQSHSHSHGCDRARKKANTYNADSAGSADSMRP